MLLLVAGSMVVSCDDDGGVIVTPQVPLAYTRFVNALPDTGGTDWRFTEELENSPVAFGLAFRAFTPYQATTPSMLRLRVFPTSTDIAVTSMFLIDTTLTFEENTYYTIVHVGYTTSGQTPVHQIVLLKDDIPQVSTDTIALRVVHLGTGLASTDVFADTLGGASPLPASPLVPLLSFRSASSYMMLPTGRLALRVTPSGQMAPVVANAVAPAGVAGDPTQNLTAIGGSRMSRSVITALLLPRSVAGTSAPQTAGFTSPALVFLVDRNPR
jgi:hypothetical protein